MKQRPCFLTMSFISLTFVITTQSTGLWSCLETEHVILCRSEANNALKGDGEGLVPFLRALASRLREAAVHGYEN